MTDFPTDWWNEFEALGEDDVRKRVGAVVWDAHKLVAARQWLEAREKLKGAENRRETLAVAREANDIARSNKRIAMFALIIAAIALLVSIISMVLKSH